MKTIKIDTANLSFPLHAFDVRRGCAYSVLFRDVPREIYAVQVTVIAPDGTQYNPVPCSLGSDGSWKANLSPLLFPNTGRGKYEVWGLNEAGEMFALGVGTIRIGDFESAELNPVSPTGKQIITAIPDRSGQLHNVYAVETEDGEYTWVIED